MNAPRQMISIDLGGGRFNLRAAGIALREGRVLVHRAQWDTHWTLPGGRVEVGEESDVALAREIEEEMGVIARIGALRFVMENFFSYNGISFHEMGLYYAVTLPEAFPFRTDGEICHECVDGNAHLQFKWVDAREPSLAEIGFQPERLRGRLLGSDAGLTHITHREAER